MNSRTTQIIIAMVLIGVSFYGGMKYEKNKNPLLGNINRSGNFVAGQNGMRINNRGGSGAMLGEIISKDENGITVKSQDGSSKIILISKSTSISKQADGTLTDLVIGKSVSINGTVNSDGSITAVTVQLRPAMMFGSTTPVR